MSSKKSKLTPFKKISTQDKKLLKIHKGKHEKNKSFKNNKDLTSHMRMMRVGLMKGMNFNDAHIFANQRAVKGKSLPPTKY